MKAVIATGGCNKPRRVEALVLFRLDGPWWYIHLSSSFIHSWLFLVTVVCGIIVSAKVSILSEVIWFSNLSRRPKISFPSFNPRNNIELWDVWSWSYYTSSQIMIMARTLLRAIYCIFRIKFLQRNAHPKYHHTFSGQVYTHTPGPRPWQEREAVRNAGRVSAYVPVSCHLPGHLPLCYRPLLHLEPEVNTIRRNGNWLAYEHLIFLYRVWNLDGRTSCVLCVWVCA